MCSNAPSSPNPASRHGHDVESLGASACRNVIGDEAKRERRQQLDQATRETGQHQPHQVRGRSMQGDPQQVRRSHVPRRQWPIEHPGFIAQRAGAIRRDPDTALADRVDFPIAPERSRQQRHRPAVFGAERQQRVAVPPATSCPRP